MSSSSLSPNKNGAVPVAHPGEAKETTALFEELDSLLQRMLALPVAPSEEGEEPTTQPATAPLPPVEASYQVTLEESCRQTEVPSVPSYEVPGPSPSGEPEASPIDEPEPEEAPTFIFPEPRYSLWLLPLMILNWIFDLLVWPLGGFGRWLRGGRGRTWLGVVGLLLMAAAAGIVLAEWFGWTW